MQRPGITSIVQVYYVILAFKRDLTFLKELKSESVDERMSPLIESLIQFKKQAIQFLEPFETPGIQSSITPNRNMVPPLDNVSKTNNSDFRILDLLNEGLRLQSVGVRQILLDEGLPDDLRSKIKYLSVQTDDVADQLQRMQRAGNLSNLRYNFELQ